MPSVGYADEGIDGHADVMMLPATLDNDVVYERHASAPTLAQSEMRAARRLDHLPLRFRVILRRLPCYAVCCRCRYAERAITPDAAAPCLLFRYVVFLDTMPSLFRADATLRALLMLRQRCRLRRHTYAYDYLRHIARRHAEAMGYHDDTDRRPPFATT